MQKRQGIKESTDLCEAITALVVDDNLFSTKVFATYLKRIQIRHVFIAHNGLEALTILRHPHRTIHLILLDINMPEMDGIEFLRHLVSLDFHGGIIITSGVDDGIISMVRGLSQAHQLNCIGSIKKPAAFNELKAIIERYIQKKDLSVRSTLGAKITLNDIEKGITEGAFVNYYQPKISIHTEEIIGCEALMRWPHPCLGLIYPDTFMPVLTKANKNLSLTKTLIAQAMRDLTLMNTIKPHLKLSMNITIQDINWLNLPDYLSEQAQIHAIHPNQIILELTETELLENVTRSLETLARLRLHGFHLSIDDFGTGFSNLEKLQLISFDEIKIDRMFVHNAHLNPTTQAILSASCLLGKKLGMLITAEGAENEQDKKNLLALGVDFIQGYYYSKPIPLQAFLLMLPGS